ncbi:GEVED domain-containing protein [Carboxylicivirga taeanensis]|uniref:GEVED domain-containing protein n=1 Tax=Carboxylicivirga taeanensis TaxID=1416875 RepID=UPI003F6E31E9
MKYNYIVLILTMILLGTGVNAQSYNDGDVFNGDETTTGNWNIKSGFNVTIEGNFNSLTDGLIRGGNLTIRKNYNHTGWSRDDIENGSRVEVFGNLNSTQSFYVREGATVIVHGDYTDRGGSSYIRGILIVLGSVDLRGVNISGSGKLIVGKGGIIRNAGGDYRGDVYDMSGTLAADKNAPVPSKGFADKDQFLIDEVNNDELNRILGDLGLLSNVEVPTGFTYTNLSGSTIDLKWKLNANSDDVMIAWSNSDLNDRPVDGSNYALGAILDAGSEIIYKGKLEAWSYNGLTPGEIAYLRIWSYTTPGNEYSMPVKLKVEPLSSNTIFYDGFEGTQSGEGSGSWSETPGVSRYYIPFLGWLKEYSNNDWTFGAKEKYAGRNSKYISKNADDASYNTELRYTGQNYISDMRLTLSGIDTKHKSVELSFYWKCVGEPTRDEGALSINGTWYDGYAGQGVWIQETIDITDAVSNGRATVDFRFTTNHQGGVDPGFCIDEVRVIGSEVARVRDFKGTALSSEEVALEWTKNAPEDNVLIAYSPCGSIGRPQDGKSYSSGDFLPDGGVVVYSGAAENYTHTGNFSGQLTYKIWTKKGGAYSSAKAIKVRMPVALPFVEDFEESVDAWSFGDGANKWVHGAATANQGSGKSAYISNDMGVTAGYDAASSADTYLELEVDLRNYESASLDFEWRVKGDYWTGWGEVLVDGNRRQSTEGREYYYDVNDWNKETISLNSFINGIHTVQFRWRNHDFGSPSNPGFCIDDVKITGTIAEPKSFAATNPNDVLNNLTWEKNAYNDDVLILYSESTITDSPQNETLYEVGDVLPNGSIVLYHGDLLATGAAPFEHAPLKYGTIYNYRAFSSRNGIYSKGIDASANTPAKVTVLFEDWEDSNTYSKWTVNTPNKPNNWLIGGRDTFSEGTKSAYIRNNNSTTAGYNISNASESWLEVEVDLEDLNTASLSFDWKCDGEAGSGTVYDYGEVYINTGSNDILLSDAKEFYGSGSWQQRDIDLSKHLGNLATIKFKWYNDRSTGGPLGFCIDNIEVGGIYDPTSTVSNGVAEVVSISSIINTPAEQLSVFSFNLNDNGSRYAETRTLVQQLVISQEDGNNTIDKWSDAIAGAVLYGTGLPGEGVAGSITSSSITFTGTDMIELEESTQPSGNYSLSIWLKSDLNASGIYEGDAFGFVVKGSDIVTGKGDDFIKVTEAVSGAIRLSVEATELRFTQQPPAYASVNTPLSQFVEVSATDANGNVDKDYNKSIILSNDGPSGPLTMDYVSEHAGAGSATFDGLIFTQKGTTTLSATSGTNPDIIATNNVSDEVEVTNYCTPISSTSANRWITLVNVGTINNFSGNDNGYGDYLSHKTTLIPSKEYDITVGVSNNGSEAYGYVWVDWNGDEVFADNERYSLGSTTRNGITSLTGTINNIPADAKVGSTRMRVRFSTDIGNTPCNDVNGEVEDYTIIIASNGWLGQNQQWDATSNWMAGVLPDSNTDVHIPEYPYYNKVYPVITPASGEAFMKNLEIDNNASLTIKPGALVNIAGNITNSGDLVIENTIPEPASVITNPAKTIIGEATIRWTYGNLFYWFIGHSISNPSMVAYRNILNDPNQRYVLYDYKESGDIINMGRVAGFEFASGAQDPERLRGYQLKVLNPATIEHKGQLNNEPYYQKPVYTGTGWQIIANPYPAYYKLPFGTDDFAATDGSVYITKGTHNANKSFEIYNTVSEVATPKDFDGVIAPTQAFYIKTLNSAPAGAQITMRASQCTNVLSTPTLKSGGNSDKQLLRLYLSNEYGLTDEAVIGLYTNGELGINRQDSEQRMYSKTNYSYIYSVVDQQKMAINILPQLVSEYQQVLGVQTKPGKQKLRISGLQQLDGAYEVILEDKATQPSTLTLMNNEIEYEFTAEEGVFHDRFVLHFKPGKAEVPTDIDDVADESASVSVYVHNDATLKVNCKWEIERKTVEVYTISGSLLLNDVFEGEVFTTDLSVSPGVYIVKVRGEEQSYEQKLFIR